jgi:hypothetical protein
MVPMGDSAKLFFVVMVTNGTEELAKLKPRWRR